MPINLDEVKYDGASAELRGRFFSFARTVEVREISGPSFSWRYLDMGPKERPAVLFFTGGIKNPVFSFAVISALSRACRVIAPFQPPCRTLAEFFDGVELILDREGIGAFSAAGSSWGGSLVQAAIIRFGTRVQRAIMANTGMRSGKMMVFLLRLHRRMTAKKAPAAVVEDFRTLALKLLGSSEETRGFWEAVFDDLYVGTMTKDDYMSLIDTQIDYVENYAKEAFRRGFGGPVLILSARDETAGSRKDRDMLMLMRAYPDARVHIFAAGGHHPALMHFEEYARVVEDFLRDPHAGSAGA